MAIPAAAQAELSRLRRDIARIEGRLAEEERLPEAVLSREPNTFPAAPQTELPKPRKPRRPLKLGIPPLDAVLGGGLPLAALTEIRASQSRDGGAASGFALSLVARLMAAGKFSALVWIGEAD